MRALRCRGPDIIHLALLQEFAFVFALDELAEAIHVRLVGHLHHALLFMGQLPTHLLQHAGWVAFVVEMHVVGEVFWQGGAHRGLFLFRPLLPSMQCLFEFLEWRLGVCTSAKLLPRHWAVQVERLHRSLRQQDTLIVVLE